MKVTNDMLISNFLQNVDKGLAAVAHLQEQISSGRRIIVPSDDPQAAIKTLSLKDNLSQNEQFMRNITDGLDWLKQTEATIDRIADILNEIEGLANQGNNSISSQDEKDAIAFQIDQMLSELLALSNLKYKDKYIFAGQKTDTQPFTLTSDTNGRYVEGIGTALGDLGLLTREIEDGISVSVNIRGPELFQPNGEREDGDLFQVIIDMSDHLRDNNLTGLQADIENLKTARDRVLSFGQIVGAKISRFQAARASLESINLTLKSIISQEEDMDLAEALMELQKHQTVLQASMAVGARIIQPTLMDFLR